MKQHTEIINHYIKKIKATTYVEIGISIPENNFDKINCELKIGVDPAPNARATYPITSDEYFALNPVKADLYFLDGLHHSDQLERDIVNASRSLSPKGVLVIHDLNPNKEIEQLVPRQNKQWTGDCWRVFVGLRKKYPLIKSYCYKEDWGIGVVFPNGQIFEPGFVSDITFDEFSKNKRRLLGLI